MYAGDYTQYLDYPKFTHGGALQRTNSRPQQMWHEHPLALAAVSASLVSRDLIMHLTQEALREVVQDIEIEGETEASSEADTVSKRAVFSEHPFWCTSRVACSQVASGCTVPAMLV
jgi:hypothetical protein